MPHLIIKVKLCVLLSCFEALLGGIYLYTKTKFIFSIPLLLMIILILALCTSDSKKTKLEADYITFTYSNNGADGTIHTETWSYDSITQETNKIFENEYTSQYPLGFYDKVNQLVYYTKNLNSDNKNKGDQIYVTDLTDNSESQLTDNLFAINYMSLWETKSFSLAVLRMLRY